MPQAGTGHSGLRRRWLDAVPGLTFGLAQLMILRSRGMSTSSATEFLLLVAVRLAETVGLLKMNAADRRRLRER